MKTTNMLIALSIVLAGTACVQVPKTIIKVPLVNGGIASLEAPKDSRLEGLKIDFVNGTMELRKYEARMNPDVIGASADGQAILLKGYMDLVSGLMRLTAASQGVPISPALPVPQTNVVTSGAAPMIIGK